MAYQNVGTPVFYVSILQWLKAIGELELGELSGGGTGTYNFESVGLNELSLVDIAPSKQVTFTGEGLVGIKFLLRDDGSYHTYRFKEIMPGAQDFGMVLGHNFFSTSATFTWTVDDQYVIQDNIINYAGFLNEGGSADYDGFSISEGVEYNDSNELGFYFHATSGVEYKFGSLLYGTYYKMPHSPQLSLTMNREMDGIKRVRNAGGTDLVDYRYSKPPRWGGLPAWEMATGAMTDREIRLSKISRRTWDLSFNHLDNFHIFPGRTTFWDTHLELSTKSNEMARGDNFFAQVIHKTNGGQLPFVFQPDSNNTSPDQFCIAKFDMNNFEFKQVANGVYNIKLKIREVW